VGHSVDDALLLALADIHQPPSRASHAPGEFQSMSREALTSILMSSTHTTAAASASNAAHDNADTLAVAHAAFGHFTHGLATGDWEPFLAMVTDDFSFFFPMGEYQGAHTGRDKARAFFAYVRSAFPDGLTVTLDRVMSNANTVVFEFRDEGVFRGAPYRNRVAVSFDIRGGRIAQYREYFGSDGKSY